MKLYITLVNGLLGRHFDMEGMMIASCHKTAPSSRLGQQNRHSMVSFRAGYY